MSPFPPTHSISNSITSPAAAITLPYHTTSQQAIEALSSGHNFYPPASAEAAVQGKRAVKKAKSRLRFRFCTCGGNVSLYDEGTSDKSVHASQMKRMSIAQKNENFPGTTLSSTNEHESSSGVRDPLSSISPANELKECEISKIPDSPGETLSSASADDQLSASSFSPQAQVLTVTRLDASQRMQASEINRNSFGPSRALTYRLAPQTEYPSLSDGDESQMDESQNTIRAQPSPYLQGDSQNESSMVKSIDDRKAKMKRRGGFISSSSDGGIPVIDVEEPSFVLHQENDEACEKLADSESTSRYTSLASSPARSSIASSASIYSTASPYIHSPWIPQHHALGRATMGVAPVQSSLHQMRNFSPPTDASSQRSSMTTSEESISETDICSIDSSTNQSPPMGDVLTHFPKLLGMDDQATSNLLHFTSSPCASSDFDGEEDALSSRIHTFGPTQRQVTPCEQHGGLDSPARTNTFIYDDNEVCDSSRTSNQDLQNHSLAPSTFASTDVDSHLSLPKSRKSRKRGAVFCDLPSVASLSIVRKGAESIGDLTWEEKLLVLSRDHFAPPNEDDESHDDDKLEEVAVMTKLAANEQRGRSSSNGQAPFSPPPDLPLPPLPTPSGKSLQRSGLTQMRACNSLTSAQKQSYTAKSSGPLHHSMKSALPRSSTCPELASIAGGYAY